MARTKRVPAKKKPAIKLEIPKEVNVPPENLSDYCICLFGEKGVGKTSLAAQFDDSLVMMLEPKRRNLSIRQVSIEPSSIKQLNEGNTDMTPWRYVQEYINAAMDDETVGTIVIDTVDRAYEACLAHHCYQKGLNHPSDVNDYGATWAAIKSDFEATMNQLLYNDMGLIFVSHAHLREVEAHDGMEQWIPTCAPAAWKYLKAVCDFALYYGYDGTDRAITLRNNSLVWSACGTENNFLRQDGTPIGQFATGKSHSEAYQNLTKAFKNQLEDEEILEPAVKKERKSSRK